MGKARGFEVFEIGVVSSASGKSVEGGVRVTSVVEILSVTCVCSGEAGSCVWDNSCWWGCWNIMLVEKGFGGDQLVRISREKWGNIKLRVIRVEI